MGYMVSLAVDSSNHTGVMFVRQKPDPYPHVHEVSVLDTHSMVDADRHRHRGSALYHASQLAHVPPDVPTRKPAWRHRDQHQQRSVPKSERCEMKPDPSELENQERRVHSRSAQPRRVRLQFSLKTVLGIVLCVALICGWATLAQRWYRLQALMRFEDRFIEIALAEHDRGKAHILVGEYAITVPMRRYILVRTQEGVGAFMLTEKVDVKDGGVRYRWFFNADVDGGFAHRCVATSESVVYEWYVRQPRAQGDVIQDAGSRTRIRCGPIELTWSLGNHLYLPDSPPMEIAYTNQTDIADVRVDDPSLIWCSRRCGRMRSERR